MSYITDCFRREEGSKYAKKSQRKFLFGLVIFAEFSLLLVQNPRNPYQTRENVR